MSKIIDRLIGATAGRRDDAPAAQPESPTSPQPGAAARQVFAVFPVNRWLGVSEVGALIEIAVSDGVLPPKARTFDEQIADLTRVDMLRIADV